MNARPDSDEAGPPLSEADIEQVAKGVQSAAPTQVSTTSPVLASLFSKGLQAVVKQPNTSNDILSALDDMTIPPPLVNKLKPLFGEIGFELATASVKDPYNQTKTRAYTAATGRNVEVVVLHLPTWVLQTADAIAFLMQAITNIRDRHGRIISEGLDRATIGYRTTLKSVSDREPNYWMFVPWGDIEEAFSGQTPIGTVFAIPLPAPANQNRPPVGGAALGLQIDRADLDAIVDIFVTEAGNDPNFFPGLVQAADWPEALKTQVSGRWTGNAKDDAWYLLNLLVARNRYNINHPHHGDTYLGWLLLRLLDSVGNPADETIAGIVIKYSLVTGPDDLQVAKARLPQQ